MDVKDTKDKEKVIKEKEVVKGTTVLKNIIILLEKIVIIALFCFFILKYFFGFIRMDNNSMNPYILEGDLLVVYKQDKEYDLEDVVLFELDGKEYILRVVAVEGQEISITDTGKLLIDGWQEERVRFTSTSKAEEARIQFPYKVDKGKVFVVADNRIETEDSRMFGAIDVKSIKGRIISVLRTRNI